MGLSEAEAKAQAGFADKNPVKVVECRNSGWFAEVRDEYQYVQTPGAPPRRHTFAGACGKKSRDEAFDAAWKSCRSKGGCNLNVEDMTSLVNVFVATGFDRDGVAEQGSASKAMINKDSGPGRAVYINSYCHGANEVVGLASCFAGRN